jgi:CHASE2 domain-containing sensor protein
MDAADGMDPVLRSLAAELERDDPALAALLDGRPARAHHRFTLAWLLLGPALLIPAFLLPARVVLGLAAMLLILASPGFVCWLCADTDHPATGRS